ALVDWGKTLPAGTLDKLQKAIKDWTDSLTSGVAAQFAIDALAALIAAVPKAAVGMWRVPGTGFVNVHPGEMIVPPAPAEMLRAAWWPQPAFAGVRAASVASSDATGGGAISIEPASVLLKLDAKVIGQAVVDFIVTRTSQGQRGFLPGEAVRPPANRS